ncbi:MAG: hypothetical protein GEU96_11515 [Propionibacteriales bacterium]|nr:hypothetical protein [Propionibacteriales bacterium]
MTAVAVSGTVIVVVAFVSMLLRHRPLEAYYGLFLFHNGPSAVVLLWMSRIVLRRSPRHGAGLVLLAIGVVGVTHVVVAALADTQLVAAGVEAPLTQADADGLVPADLPLSASIPLWVMGWLWVPAPVLAVTMLLLVFPDGHLPSPRWRPVVATAAAGALLLIVAFGIDGWPSAAWTTEDTPVVVLALMAAGGLAVAGAALASTIALASRWRHSDATQRQQFRTVGVAAVGFAVVSIATYPWQPVWIPAVLVTFNALIVVYAVAVARYRLHDLEPMLGRGAVAAILSVLVAAVYLLIVVGAGGAVGRGVDNVLLQLVAVGVVALLIEPARRKTRQLVDRLLYGREANRTEVLSTLAARASTSATAEDMLGEVTALMVRSTGAARAEAWLDIDSVTRLAAAAGTSDEAEPTLQVTVDNQGERFGELRLYARAAVDLVSDAPQLLDDVAHALGVVLRNDRLTAQLRTQLDELQASRQRLVEAHDRARRSLERDIHDGAQARLISLRLRLGALRARADVARDPRLAGDLDALGREVDTAVRSLRNLARGLHPPILEQAGLPAALRAHVRDLPIPVAVTARGIGRYQRAVEGAAYFSCLEAVQNAVRHSEATCITVELNGDAAVLRFCVRDDGTGFDSSQSLSGTGLTNIDDRMSALGGQTHIDSAPGRGTRITGKIPAQPLNAER